MTVMDHTNATTTAIEERIATYTPTTLPGEPWERHAAQIRGLVTAAGPSSTEDAKCLLVAVCKFVAWRHRLGLPINQLRTQLDEGAISAYAAHLQAASTSRAAVNEIGRLRRIHRRINHVPEPDRSTPKPRRSSPYTEDEIAALSETASPELLAAIDLALDSGIVIPDAYNSSPGLTRAQWAAARAAARATGITLDSVRLRATWVHRVARQRRSALGLIRSGMTRSDLQAIARAREPLTRTEIELAR